MILPIPIHCAVAIVTAALIIIKKNQKPDLFSIKNSLSQDKLIETLSVRFKRLLKELLSPEFRIFEYLAIFSILFLCASCLN